MSPHIIVPRCRSVMCVGGIDEDQSASMLYYTTINGRGGGGYTTQTTTKARDALFLWIGLIIEVILHFTLYITIEQQGGNEQVCTQQSNSREGTNGYEKMQCDKIGDGTYLHQWFS